VIRTGNGNGKGKKPEFQFAGGGWGVRGGCPEHSRNPTETRQRSETEMKGKPGEKLGGKKRVLEGVGYREEEPGTSVLGGKKKWTLTRQN